jgi:DNA-binding MarR family transcriptional regulator
VLELFVCHAAGDAELAGRLVRLIERALRLPAEAIRCTSVNGYRLAIGANADLQLPHEVVTARVVVWLVSPASVASNYVQFELGARWGADRLIMPVLAPGISPSIFSESPLRPINALSVEDPGQLHQLIGDLARVLGVTPQSAAVYQRELEEVVKWEPSKAESLPAVQERPSALPPEEVRMLVAFSAVDGDDDGLTLEDLASGLKLERSHARYVLDCLEERELVEEAAVSYVGEAARYLLTKKGRRHVFEQRLSSS